MKAFWVGLVACTLLVSHQVRADPNQPPVVAWEQAFDSFDQFLGFSANELVQQTPDNGYIVAGLCENAIGVKRYYLLRLDAVGNEVWRRELSQQGISVGLTADGGYIVCGNHYLLTKIDALGNEEWSRPAGGDVCRQTSDGGYIALGGRAGVSGNEQDVSDVLVTKMDGAGNKIWEKTYGGAESDTGVTILETPGGNYVVAGMTGPPSPAEAAYKAYLFEIDRAGNQLWSQIIEEGENVFITSAAQTNDGGFVLTGMIYPVWRPDILLLKTDALGHKEWSHILDILYGDGGLDVIADGDGFTVTGFVGSHADIHFNADMYLARFDLLGQQVWSMLIGTDTDSEEGRSLAKTSDGGYVVVGRSLIRSPFAEKLSVVKLVPPEPAMFVRGDVNADGVVDIADPIFLLSYLFANTSVAPSCMAAGDANDDGQLDISDPIFILQYLFASGPAFPSPYPECGFDQTADSLGCATFTRCQP